mmetsp:Transcript_13099/g.15533  ORF Transcript_13099/g.15533 Transcript_13099/m.15533 type:complete len:120 (-) Transcript_13099:415-774(-)
MDKGEVPIKLPISTGGMSSSTAPLLPMLAIAYSLKPSARLLLDLYGQIDADVYLEIPSKRARTPIPMDIRKDCSSEPERGFEGYADATHMTVFEDCQPAIRIATNPGSMGPVKPAHVAS